MLKRLVNVVLVVSVVLSIQSKENIVCEESHGVQTAKSEISQCVAEHISEASAPPETMITISAPEMESPQIEKIYDVELDGGLQEYIIEVCDEYGFEPELILAIIQVESGFDASAISKTNDYGLMQINKCNHQGYEKLLGVTDFLDPKQNILAGVYMLASLRDDYGCNTEDKMLMAYNLGIGKARKLWEQGIVSTDYSTKILSIKYNYRIVE